MTNTLNKDSNNVVYEGLRNIGAPAFVAKQGAGPITTDSDGVQSQPQAIASAFTEIAGQGTSVVNGVNTDLFPSTDVSAYRWVSFHITGTYSGTLTFQGSNDNANWVSAQMWDTSNSGQSGISSNTTSSGKIWYGPVNFRFLRVRMTSFTSNTSLAGTMELYTVASEPLPSTSFATPNTPSATTSGGTNDYHVISAASTNAANIKASAGQVYGYDIGNSGTTDAWVKLFNKASAPTLGTDTPLRTIYAPKGQSINYYSATGIAFGTGIAIAVTGAAADADSTAVTAGAIQVDIDWK